MPTYTVLSPLLHNKRRYNPGDTVELSPDLAQSLLKDGVIEQSGAQPPLEPSHETHHEKPGEGEAESSPSLLNINTATAEEIATQINGIGAKTAEAVVKLRSGKPDGRFTSLNELKAIARVDWDAVFPLITLD